MASREGEFERIVLPHARSLLRFALRLAGDSSQAEDLVQETLLLAWRGFGRFETGTNVRAWLFRILLNAFRQQRRKSEFSQVYESSIRAVPITPPPSDESVAVRQAFNRLGSDQRTVLLLAAVEGFTCREISEMLDVPTGTVMSRLSRAREAMRELLSRVTQ
jgi:RNA polymerase sigma-70 factor (ECF subfamily)